MDLKIKELPGLSFEKKVLVSGFYRLYQQNLHRIDPVAYQNNRSELLQYQLPFIQKFSSR